MDSNVEVISTKIYVLKLDLQEAMWLKSLVQNPIREHETVEEELIRDAFWYALTEMDVPLR